MKTNCKVFATTWIFVFLNLFSFNTHAIKPSYNFLSFEYANRNIDDVVVDPISFNSSEEISFDGVSLTGSIEINDKWFAELRYLSLDGDQVNITGATLPGSSFGPTPVGAVTGTQQSQFDTKVTLTSTSIGYQFRQDENSSAFVAVGIASVDVELTTHSEYIFRDATGNIVPPDPWMPYTQTLSESDTGAIISVGYRTSFWNQMQLGIRVDNVYIDDSEISVAGELLYRFSNAFAVQVASEIADDETQFSAGIRFIF